MVNNSTDWSVSAQYDQADSFELLVVKTSICMLVLSLSLIENVIVLAVLRKNYRNRLRTANSYFLANMSIADALFALQNLPLAYNHFMLKAHWVLQGPVGMVLCKIDVFFSLISMVTINLTILAIAVNRFFAVYIPLKRIITRRMCFLLIFLSWFIPTLFASPMLYYAGLQRENEQLTVCIVPNQHVLKIWYIVLTGILSTTLMMMFVLYTAIGVKLWRRKFPFNVSQRAQTQRERRNREIFKMLVTLILVFCVCSFPLFVLQMSYVLGFYTELKKRHGLFIAIVMMFMNGVINPIIYFTFNRGFRDGFKKAFCRSGCIRRTAYALNRRMTASRRTWAPGIDRRTSTQL